MTYFTTEENWIYDDTTDTKIPVDPKSELYQTYLAWIAAGNTPGELNIATEADFIAAVDNVLHAKAVEKGYDNIVSACSYASTANAFQNEAIAFLTWRSAVWTYCYQVLADVQNNVRPKPTVAQLVSELPSYTPPV